ncbi:PREDICTED: aldehyde oxidase GLOX1 [Nelumbo nucifera]|uniref:Aldehyde oxidase GLOX1 n=1 Tax=Nelumbo nucifera TaxID=4432 RepID=A0A1U7ZKD1_NELNU|nr:PREDICTED: aldehyde oxidase GLOX1 [Nelumbo nucifera]
MAALHKALCLLPIFFILGLGQPFFFGGRGYPRNPPNFNYGRGFRRDPPGFNFGRGGFGRDPPNFDFGGDEKNNDDVMKAMNPDFVTMYKGGWELASINSGVSAMHLILLPNNKAIMFDATNLGPSLIQLPHGNCRPVPGKNGEVDCWAHSVEYNIATGNVRTLKVLTDPWCSSGSLSVDGNLVQTGGWFDGGRAVRYLSACDTCDWKEYPTALSGQRWYATQQILPDGSFIVVGGRRMFNYEFVPEEGKSNPTNYDLPLLRETTDEGENNLYPFVHLSTDGSLFILANNRSILLNPVTGKVVREFPVLPGGSRNYPASGMSALLPIKLYGENAAVIPAEVLVCGGARSEAYKMAEKFIFLPALQSCGRIHITKPDSVWKMEHMPSPRVMGDMLNLPTGDILMINGAKRGTSGWEFADEPNFTPVLYKPKNKRGDRFTELAPTAIPRMYHSSSAVLPDGKILVAGSNTHNAYNFTVKFPTEVRVEKFWPPYLDPLLKIHKPTIVQESTPQAIKYGEEFTTMINLLAVKLDKTDLKVTMYAPPFTTHGYSMNQRLLVLAIREVVMAEIKTFRIKALAPPTSAVAPPGYYLLFVVHRGVPSHGVWVRINK